MKLLVKVDNQLKTVQYTEQTTLKVLCEQIGLSNPNAIRFTYKDDEDDIILVTCDEDLKVVVEMAKPKQIIVLLVDCGGSNNEEVKEEQKKDVKSESESVREKKQKKKKKKEEKRKNKQIKRKKQNQQLSQILGTLLQQKLQLYVPCIANQLYSKFNPHKNHKTKKNQPVLHQNIKCSGCAVLPIQGIRYQCLTCFNFNLCQNCQKDIDHPHNLLKMKRVEEIQKIIQSCESSDDNEFAFLSKKQEEQKTESKKQKKPKDIKNVKRFNKFTRILMDKFGYDETQCSEFAKHNLHVDKDMLISRFREKHNIQLTDEELMNRVRKLQFYFSAMEVPEGIDFKELVYENRDKKVPKLLLEIRKRHPDFNFDAQSQEALFRMNRKFKREKKQIQSWANQSKIVGSPILLSDKPKEQEKVQNIQSELPEQDLPLIKNPSRTQQISKIQITFDQKTIREKGKILVEMKQIFGEDRASDLFKFIQKNFELGMQRIIQKWLAEEYDQKNM